MDEQMEQREGDLLRALQEERFNLTQLKEQKGFRYLMEIAQAQIDSRQQQIFLTPLKSLDETLGQEFLKGELSGITLFKRFVDIRIEALTEEITEKLEQLQENRDDRRNNDTSGGTDLYVESVRDDN